jgi:heptosyltransferase I
MFARPSHPRFPAAVRPSRSPSLTLPGSARVLIVMMSAVGDAVHVLPVVRALRRHDPTVHLTWVLQPGPASLVRGHPDVDEILVFDRRAGLRGFRDLRRSLRGRSFDVVLGLQVYLKASLVMGLASAPVKLGFDRARARDLSWLFTNRRIPSRSGQHVQDQYFEFLDVLGVHPEPVEWGLGPWEAEREAQERFFAGLPGPAAVLVIGSSRAEKDWLPERWAALADRLVEEHGLTPVLAGGRSDRELATAERVRRVARHPVRSTLGVPLRQLVGILDGAALVVTLDTGPLHIAVALGTPTITLAGFFDPDRVGPYRRFHDLIVDAWHEPDEPRAPSAQSRPGRMVRIGVDDVLARVGVWRERYAPDRLARLRASGFVRREGSAW